MQPLPLVVADQQFPVSLARLVRATLQPEPEFIEAHYRNMGYWAIAIEPWARDAGALSSLQLSVPTQEVFSLAHCNSLHENVHGPNLSLRRSYASHALSVDSYSADV